jgi:hypothetical protein
MATATKKAAPTAKKASPRKVAPAAKPAPVAKLLIPAPVQKSSSRAHRFEYTGKLASETRQKTPQFVAMIAAMQDIEDPKFDPKGFELLALVQLAVKEGHLAMPNTKNPDKQMRRIVAYYKARLIEEGYVKQV